MSRKSLIDSIVLTGLINSQGEAWQMSRNSLIDSIVLTGLINSQGEAWQLSRRFAMRQLGSYGLGNSKMEQSIQHEVMQLLQHFRETRGQPVVLDSVINVAVLNVIWQLVASENNSINIGNSFYI